MTDDQTRTVELLTRVAAGIHAPAGALARIDRAAAPSARLSARLWPRLLVLAAAAVALAIVVDLALPAQASAAAILTRAERAATSGTPALTSYRGTISGESWMGADGSRQTAASTFVQQVSAVVPNKLRLETTGTGSDGAIGHQVLVSDGTSAWAYAPDAKLAQPVEPQFVAQQGPFAASTLGGALRSFAQEFDATQEPDATVAGRAAYVIRLVPKGGNPLGQRATSLRMWIDRQTLLQVGAEMNDASGVLMRWSFTALEVNLDLAASTFVFTLPDGVHVAPIVPPAAQAAAAQAMRAQQWTMVATQAAFTVYRPLASIEGLEQVGPGTTNDGLVVVGFRIAGGPVVAMVQQGAPSAFPVAAGGSPLTLGDLSATYRLAKDMQTLDFDRGGTHVRVQAPARMPKEALLAIAVSLVAVPKP